MRISLDWVGDYVDLPAELTPDQLAYDLTMSTVEVEKVEDLSEGLRDVVVARVQSTEKHPKADRLQVVQVDDGAGGRTVVCGGTNVVEGMLVALALPGAVCRSADGSPMEIRTAKVRGVESSGMLCASVELGLKDLFVSHGKDIIDLGDLPVTPGTSLAKAIHHDDVVLEIDNKSLTNRPDLWGHHGVARELAALYDVPLKPLPAFKKPRKKPDFDVQIEDEARCGRYTATRIHGVKASVSPLWMRSRLAKVGQRPINFLVDLTNYVMMAVGQPSHAFDARDVPERIRVRRARADEELKLLDDTELKLDDDCLVIANDKDAVALAGVMGGELAVRDDTSSLLLEMANFSAVQVRRVARRFGLRTESSIRFEKGVDPDRIDLALGLFVDLLRAEQSKAKVDIFVDNFPQPLPSVDVDVEIDYLHRRLGLEIPPKKMKASLSRLGFEAKGDDTRWTVRVPSWRSTGDVSIPEDIVEEIARLYGYEALGFSPPTVVLDAPVIQPRRRMERRIKEALATRAGMREVMNYPWVSTALLDASGLADLPTIGLAHPPSPDLRLSPSLVPQMLATVASNLRYNDTFAIFELNRVFLADATAKLSEKEEPLPVQPRKLVGAFVGDDSGALFYRAKGVLERLVRFVQCEPIAFGREHAAPWGDKAAQLSLTVNGQAAGALAVLSSRTKRKSGIKGAEVALFELDVDLLTPFASRQNEPEPLKKFPQVDFDISVIVAREVEWASVMAVAAEGDPLVQGVSFVDEYVGTQVPDGHKSVTLRLCLGSDEGTLVREQIDEASNRVMGALKDSLGGVIRD